MLCLTDNAALVGGCVGKFLYGVSIQLGRTVQTVQGGQEYTRIDVSVASVTTTYTLNK